MPARERNLARWTFLDPRARVVYPQWDVVAPQMVAIRRRAAGTRGGNPRLAALVAELTAASPDFARWWGEYPDRDGAIALRALIDRSGHRPPASAMRGRTNRLTLCAL